MGKNHASQYANFGSLRMIRREEIDSVNPVYLLSFYSSFFSSSFSLQRSVYLLGDTPYNSLNALEK